MRDKGRLYLHVGLAKTGTTFLQALLAENRPRLREAGFIYPFVRPEGMFHAAVEVRGDHARWGLDPELIDGTWQALLDKAAAFEGTSIISHEILAGADEEQIAKAAGDLDGFDLHVVVTARDLARQVPAHWQEAVKNGQTFSFEEYSREVLRDADAPDSYFWNEQDLVGVLDRWAPLTSPDRVHVVIGPPPGADSRLLWHRFAEATGLPTSLGDLEVTRRNESLGASEVHLLRAVNRELAGRIPQPAYAHVVKRLFAQSVLAGSPSVRAETPEALREPLTAVAATWVDEISDRGYNVHGDLAELMPSSFGTVDPDALERSAASDVPILVAAILDAVVGLVGAEQQGPETHPAPEPRREVPTRRRRFSFRRR